MNSLFAIVALARAGFVLAREGVFSAIPAENLPFWLRIAHRLAGWLSRDRSKSEARSERLSRALNKLGPSWVKLGQFLATRPDVVGVQIARDLELLQDRMEAFSTTEAKQAIEASLGRPIEELFAELGEPVAAASVAQVHKATLKDDPAKEVAVKVIRPGVRPRFLRDLELFYFAARLQERFIPAARRLRPVSVVDILAQSARLEMDLRLEAAAFSEMRENTANDEGFRVPDVDWERTGRDVVTMDWVDGVKLTKVRELEKQGIDKDKVAVILIQSFLRHTLRDGFFHADMHPGNLFIDEAGCIVAVDLGIAGRLGAKERLVLAEILYGFITRDYMRVAQVHFDAGYVPAHHQVASFAQAIRAIGEPIHGQSAETVSMAKLLTLLFEVTELFDMKTQPQLLLLQKTMVVVEGVARKLDPKFNMWQASEPVVGQWIARKLGPVGKLEEVKEGLHAISRLAAMAPEFVDRTERLGKELDTMSANGIRLDAPTIEAIGKAEARYSRSGRVALVVIAIAAVIVVWQI